MGRRTSIGASRTGARTCDDRRLDGVRSWFDEYQFAVSELSDPGMWHLECGMCCASAQLISSHLIASVCIPHANYSHRIVACVGQVIFKSMKLITALVGSVLWLRNKHKIGEFIAAALLVASAVLFTLGDAGITAAAPITPATVAAAEAAAASAGAVAAAGSEVVAAAAAGGSVSAAVSDAVPWFGLVIVLASLVFDSLHSNSQERVMKNLHAGPSETMVFTNLFSAALLFVWVVFTGEIVPAVQYCYAYPQAYPYWVLRASVIYYGVKCFLALIKTNGNVLATSVTTVRKILSILLSFLMFPKPFTMNYAYGVIAFFLSFVFNLQVIMESNREREAKRQAELRV